MGWQEISVIEENGVGETDWEAAGESDWEAVEMGEDGLTKPDQRTPHNL